MQEIEELKRQGLSIRAISRLTGYDRKTISKYLVDPEGVPVYLPRAKQPGKLDPFHPYLQGRMQAGVWNARVLLRELRERGYSGGYTLLTDWLRPQRQAAQTMAVRRFETPAGRQAQVNSRPTPEFLKSTEWGLLIVKYAVDRYAPGEELRRHTPRALYVSAALCHWRF